MFTYIKSHAVLMTSALIVVAVVSVIAARAAKPGSVAESDQGVKSVSLVDASGFRTDAVKVDADGVVESSQQVDLRAQIAAPIATLPVSIGTWVSAGQTIAALQSSDIQSQLDQAAANLAVVKAQYNSASVSLGSAQKSLSDGIQSTYTKVDDAIHTQADQMFGNPRSADPQLLFSTSNSQLAITIQNDRASLEKQLSAWRTQIAGLSASSSDADIDAYASSTEAVLASSQHFLDELSEALNSIIVTSPDIASQAPIWKSVLTAARASVSGTVASLTGAVAALDSARSAAKDAGSVSTASAQVLAAQAAVDALKVQLDKTIIRSPISGQVASLPLKPGELVSPGTLVAQIVNTGGLQIDAYISDADYSKIKEGSPAVITGSELGSVNGFVSKIAPSIDQASKKVEIKVAINSPSSSGLVVGQSAQVAITGIASTGAAAGGTYLLPIQDVKIGSDTAAVYTVDADSKIVSHPVTLGEVKDDFVEVKQGLSDGMMIVSPVYELQEGDKVDIR